MVKANGAAAAGSSAGVATDACAGTDSLETLDRLRAEAELVDELLSHVDDQRREARRRRERLERRSATGDEADRIENAGVLLAEAATLESTLTRLRAATSITKAFVRLRSGELGSLIAEGQRRTEELDGEQRVGDAA